MFYPPTSRISVATTEDMVMHHLPTAPPGSRTTTPGPQAKRPSQLNLTKTVVFSAPGSPEDESSDVQRSTHSPSPSESTLSSLESEYGDSGKIPKPNGEAGRPGRGGYNLEEQLGWGEAGFKELKRFVNKAVKRHLDMAKCRSLQERKALEAVRDITIARFPDLDGFENYWPVFDLIQLRLKYTSSRCRQKERAGAGMPKEIRKGKKSSK
ncbi:hypothetical protein BU15DRAFT_66407 [Melanogaster broomeanus]|nr:hypothetical protein BU15DRAFT_66407 [Melanogaster broomeanus]